RVDVPRVSLDGWRIQRVPLGYFLERASLAEQEFERASDVWGGSWQQLGKFRWQHMHHAGSRQQLVPGHLRMKKSGRHLGGQDQLRGSGERGWSVPGESQE